MQRLRAIDHVGHRVVLAIPCLGHARGGRPAALLEVVGPLLIHVQEPLEVGLVVFRFIDDEFPLFGRGSIGVGSLDLFIGQVRILLDQFQRLVLLHLLLDALLQGHHRQLQDLHRLDHPRRQHLLLNQSQLLSEGKSHGDPSVSIGVLGVG